jgi:DNA polymerase-3 subunit delta'
MPGCCRARRAWGSTPWRWSWPRLAVRAAHGAGRLRPVRSCHAIEVRTHADLCVLMPETAMLALGWPLSEKAQDEIDDKKRKPSREIRVDAMRDAVEFAQRTSARGRGKAVLVYPAERMNHVTANALLKTLEEPPGDVRFVLASEAAHQLLPTIRSRCLGHTMVWPQDGEAQQWLQSQGIKAADTPPCCARPAAGPMTRWHWCSPGATRNPGRCCRAPWPGAMPARWPAWTPAQAVDALQKLCHDLLAVKAGAAPRFFDAAGLPPVAGLAALTALGRELAQTARTVEHPFNAGLMLERLPRRPTARSDCPKLRKQIRAMSNPSPTTPAPASSSSPSRKRRRCTRRTSLCSPKAACSFPPRATTSWVTTSMCC